MHDEIADATRASASESHREERILALWLQCRLAPDGITELANCLSQEPYSWRSGSFDLASWQSLLLRAEQERIQGLMYGVIRNRHLCPPPVEKQLHDAYAYTAVRNRMRLGELSRILTAALAAKCPILVLKGAALTLTLYNGTGLRPMDDLDILVHPDDVLSLLTALQPHWYTWLQNEVQPGMTLAYANEIALFGQVAGAGIVEVHWSPFDSLHHQQAVNWDWVWEASQYVTLDGLSVPVFQREAQLLHLCGHLALHHSHHRQLLWMHDIAALLHQESQHMDWERLLALAAASDLVLSVRSTLARVCSLWTLPIPEEVLHRLGAMPVSRQEESSFLSRTAPKRPVVQRFWTDLLALPAWRERWRFALGHLFPTASYMRQRYGVKRSLFLPLAYPYRWLLGLWEWVS